MTLFEAESLTLPYIQHPAYKKLEEEIPRLQELTKQIQDAMETQNFNPIVQGITIVDEKTAEAFHEFAKICKEKLSTV
ncbi:MAG: hypothetical protein ABFQ53_02285 [Patescibacteria group bacterium]